MPLTPNFLLQILDKIGVPLASAVEDVSARNKDVQASDSEEAKMLAQLIGQTIQIILPLSGAIIQGTNEQEADAVRLTLAGIAAPLVGGIYRTQGRAPNENDIKRIVKAMEATLAFSDNFSPAIGQDNRLKMLGEDSFIFDAAQVDMCTLDVLVPVINAIGEFSFGQSETKLLQDVSNKLIEKAAFIAKGGDKLAELSALKTLARLYAQCHKSETGRLSRGGEDNRDTLSTDPVWKAFDSRLAMLGALLEMPPMQESTGGSSIAPQATSPVSPVSGAAVATTTAPAQMAQPQPAVPQIPPVQATLSSAPPQQPPTQAATQAGGGPMSFFSGPAPAATTPPPQQPVVAPLPAQAESVPAANPPPSGGGGPMSFFKAPPKTDDKNGSQ